MRALPIGFVCYPANGLEVASNTCRIDEPVPTVAQLEIFSMNHCSIPTQSNLFHALFQK